MERHHDRHDDCGCRRFDAIRLHLHHNAVERVLDTYCLDEIFELNDVTEVEVLQFLVEEEFVKLPEVIPCDVT